MCMEMPRIELGASYMQSMRSTTELHPLCIFWRTKKNIATAWYDFALGFCPWTVIRGLSYVPIPVMMIDIQRKRQIMKVSRTFCRQNSQGQKITQPLPAFGWQSRKPSTTFSHTLCPDFPLYQKRKSRHLLCPADFLKCVFDEDENLDTKCI